MRPPLRVVRAPLALVLVTAVVAAGCGGDGGGDSVAEPDTTTTTAANEPKVMTATLTGAAARPKGPPGGRGRASVTIDLRRSRACWTFTVSGIDKPLSAHIHDGREGKRGVVVIPLGDTFARRGCVVSERPALRAVATSPADYYVNVHTARYIDGALRGRLTPA